MIGRGEHAATLLPSGEVLITGGYIHGTLPAAEGVENIIEVATPEIFDPATETFRPVDNMNRPTGDHTATLLPNEHVLVTSGSFASTSSTGQIVGHKTVASAEVCIPSNP